MKEINYTRNEIIEALRRFDEGFIGAVTDDMSTEELYERLEACSKVFSAEDLILAAKLGF